MMSLILLCHLVAVLLTSSFIEWERNDMSYYWFSNFIYLKKSTMTPHWFVISCCFSVLNYFSILSSLDIYDDGYWSFWKTLCDLICMYILIILSWVVVSLITWYICNISVFVKHYNLSIKTYWYMYIWIQRKIEILNFICEICNKLKVIMYKSKVYQFLFTPVYVGLLQK